MLKIVCDFCGKEITIKQNKGGDPKDFRLEENICDVCKGSDLKETWKDSQANVEAEWSIKIYEKRKFFEALLTHQKKDFIVQKKKDHFGSFFIEGK